MASKIYLDYAVKYPGRTKDATNTEFVTKKLDEAMDAHTHDKVNSPQIDLSINYDFASAGGNVFVRTPNFDEPYEPGSGGDPGGSGELDNQLAAELKELIGYLRTDINKAMADILTNADNHDGLVASNQAEHSAILSNIDTTAATLQSKIDLINLEAGNLTFASKTYEELLALIEAEGLIPGVKYVVTDFQTIYKQPVSNAAKIGDVEPLVVTAMSGDKLEPIAFSLLYPQDIIYYDAERNSSRYDWSMADDKGQIYRRVTKNCNDIPYDSRAIKFMRFALDFSNFSAYSGSNTYNTGDAVIYNSKVYISLDNSNLSNDPESKEVWKQISFVTGNSRFIIAKEFVDSLDSAKKGLKIDIGEQAFYLPINYSDYNEFLTFNDYSSGTIDSSNVYNNRIKASFSTKYSLTNSIFFADNAHNNDIGYNFYNNTMMNNILNNSIGDDFYENYIGDSFNNNKINNNFSNNFIESSFTYNTIANFFQCNIVSSNITMNNLSNMFFKNIIYSGFNFNSIGNSFIDNIILINFNTNIIENDFYNNKIGNYFMKNHFMNNFSNQTILDYNASSTNQLRFNTFENGINNPIEWSDEQGDLLLSNVSITFRSTPDSYSVAFMYQDTDGQIITGIIPYPGP